ncbi:hypothetical protein HYT26_01345 [Candidatus Pacearchaeota archaeon]|nr:hypothetical protein [Candidatus Pacearchaeota archaeon]
MEMIIYSNMIDLLLEYGSKTEKELIDEAVERFNFPRGELEMNVGLQLASKEKTGYIEEYKDDKKYHLLDIDFDSATGRNAFIDFLTKAPDEYFEGNQHMRKLKQAFEERGCISR